MKIVVALGLVLCGLVSAAHAPVGWTVKPAGVQIPVGALPMSAKVTPDKKFLLVLSAGAAAPSISVIDLATANETSRVQVPGAWLGLTMTKAGDRVYVGGAAKGAVYEFLLANGVLKPGRVFPVTQKAGSFVGDVQLGPDGHLLYAAELYDNSVAVINPQSGFILSHIKTGRRPYRILFHPSGQRFYVSSWADGSIGQFDTESGMQTGNLRLAPHPTEMAWLPGEVEDQPGVAARLFVSASNTNNVYVLAANESGDLRRLETVSVALTPRQPLGVSPGGLGVSADGKRVFVACGGLNAAAVVDVSGARSRVLGFVPAGGYPTAAFGLPDGRLGVLSLRTPAVELVDVADEAKLAALSGDVLANTPYRDEMLDDPGTPAGNPVRANGPIQHVIYVVTQASVRDDGGNPGFQSLGPAFSRPILFNGLEGEAAGAGLVWSTAGIANDYVELGWTGQLRNSFDFNGSDPASAPPAGYLWTAAAQAGISMRNYGFFGVNRQVPDADGTQLEDVLDPVLAPATDPDFRAFDSSYSDKKRVAEFVNELSGFEKTGKMPRLLLVRLGDEDLAVGALVEAVSKSRFWSDTAVFVMAQGGGYVASPWVKKDLVDSKGYDRLSLLRTVEIILGLHPMTTFDAAARPLFDRFSNTLGQ